MMTLASIPLSRMRVTPDLLANPVGTLLVTSENGSDAQRIVVRTRSVTDSRRARPGLMMLQGDLVGYFIPDEQCGAFVRNALDVTDLLAPILRDIIPGFRYNEDACIRGDVWHLRDETGTLFAGVAVGSALVDTAVSGYARIVDGRIGDIVSATRLAYLGRLGFNAAPAGPTLKS
ncbi:conserved hypothetical protein [Gluconacetobacter diazotrophicus PA1 5]|uniref:Uncharacterized protein n=2 Tax=Gluconacetobacter diazotrophicus TaxID=33996 RepID=A9H710_GLUDA|nr:hypothetical protein [Gluconacetobacter diazotrophicus]ACI52267.1 conserved hypothetical protein [Gluconacetobacter diazotrophicus PA1 5]MBB2156819.1 hypothetical protein [Gluconacetobacter diazotrophicus]TWB04838.1 hypothetical protein FBZ86_11960 [Gluconacetobacter diazotrophicus]CAP57580.1 unknown protein [Gluconacetobacter diazotrophicus PA1 5]